MFCATRPQVCLCWMWCYNMKVCNKKMVCSIKLNLNCLQKLSVSKPKHGNTKSAQWLK